jgi:putative spermidine/putrescine transport system ATP-binding protein
MDARPNEAGSGSPSHLTLHDLTKQFGSVRAVDKINIEVKGGEFVTLLGPSGSGKTTTLQMIAGFVRPTAGEILIDQQRITVPAYKRDIGMVFQNYALFPHMTAAENVAFPLKVRRIEKDRTRQLVIEALEMVGLADRGNSYPKQLSGGQQQRIALARALVFRPRIVLLDEPLGALDKKLREELQLELKRIQEQLQVTMLYVTHDQEEALVMSDRIAVFNEGKIEQLAEAEELYERPNSLFVADFLGESNIFRGRFTQSNGRYSLSTGKRKFTVSEHAEPPDEESQGALVVRPERLKVMNASADVKPRPGENAIQATVREVIYLGSERKYILATPDGEILTARHQVGTGEAEPHPGDEVIACWRVEHGVLVFDRPSRARQPEQEE